MSGIYGIYRYDGVPVDPQWLERMRKVMAYYGPHGGGCKIDGPVGMGHLLLEVNPEDAFERQPMRGQRGLVVTSVRLDNRDTLLDTFEIPSSEAPQVSDGYLASLAFDRWGEDVCTHLEGDWALAAWDAKERRLLLANDAYGSGSLYYYQGKGFIAFASSLKALLTLPGTQKEPDLLAIAEVLVIWQHDADLTAYKGFRRLPWAHSMLVGPDGSGRTKRYWSADGREVLRYRRDEDYVEAFLQHYTRAVKSCLRTRKQVGSQLSGGRDSGSVVALAAPLLAAEGRDLTAFTSVPYLAPDGAGERQMGNEWEMAHATTVMAGSNVRHIPIDARDYRVIEGIEYALDAFGGPGQAAGNYYWLRGIVDAAADTGIAVVLMGQLGNGTVSWEGNGSAALALLQGSVRTAIRLFFNAEPNIWLTAKRQILKPLLKPGLQAVRRSRLPAHLQWQTYSSLNANMAKELKIEERMRSAGYDPGLNFSPLQDLRRLFLVPDFGIGFPVMSEMGLRRSVVCLDPTANLSLLEFLLRVPDDLFYRKGQSSYLFRQAFKDRLPDPILHEHRKGLQSADIGHRILRELPAFQEILSDLDSIAEAQAMIDLPLLRRCLSELTAKVNKQTTARAATLFLRGIGVGLFLRRLAHSNSSNATEPC